MVVWLAYSLGPIFDFAKYLRQVCLSFSPYLDLHQKTFRSRRKKAYKRPWWGYKHFWANESVIRGTCFYFQSLLKTSGCILEQGMGKWCSMKRSISQPPKTKRRPKRPMEIKVKRVSKVWPTYSVWDRICSCNLCMMKRWCIAATPDQQPKSLALLRDEQSSAWGVLLTLTNDHFWASILHNKWTDLHFLHSCY